MSTAAPLDGRPLVSIVTPSMNQGRFIRDAIESVLAQDYPFIEYLVVDGGSTDETLDVLRSYGSRVAWISEPDRGQSDAINKGWRRSRGSILSWLCADDGLYQGAVSRIVDAFAKNPDAGLVYGRGHLVDLDGVTLASSPLGARDAHTLVHHADFICQPSAFATRAAVESAGFVDESLTWVMDWDLFIRISRIAPLVYVPDVLAWIRTHDQTKTNQGGHARFREIVRVIRRYSASRYPPGYFRVGLRTYVPIAQGAIARLPDAAGPLARRANEWLDNVSRGVSRRILRHIGADHGWFRESGWAAPELVQTIPPEASVLRVRGRVPEEYPQLKGQEITVECDGTTLARVPVTGSFVLELPLGEPTDPTARRVRIVASRWFVPRRAHLNRDRRRLAYYLDEVTPG